MHDEIGTLSLNPCLDVHHCVAPIHDVKARAFCMLQHNSTCTKKKLKESHKHTHTHTRIHSRALDKSNTHLGSVRSGTPLHRMSTPEVCELNTGLSSERFAMDLTSR